MHNTSMALLLCLWFWYSVLMLLPCAPAAAL